MKKIQKRILEFLDKERHKSGLSFLNRNNPNWTAAYRRSEIMQKELGLSKRDVDYHLGYLAEKGHIERGGDHGFRTTDRGIDALEPWYKRHAAILLSGGIGIVGTIGVVLGWFLN